MNGGFEIPNTIPLDSKSDGPTVFKQDDEGMLLSNSKFFLFLRPKAKTKENENRSGGSHRTGRLKDASNT